MITLVYEDTNYRCPNCMSMMDIVTELNKTSSTSMKIVCRVPLCKMKDMELVIKRRVVQAKTPDESLGN